MGRVTHPGVLVGGWNPTYHANRGKEPTRRVQILAWMCLYAEEHHGNSPSILEISHQFKLAYGTVYSHVQKLIAERHLAQHDNKLVVLDSEWLPPPSVQLPRDY
jgi:hypothetical protein